MDSSPSENDPSGEWAAYVIAWYALMTKAVVGMPYELRDFTPALRFLEQDPETNAMMIQTVLQGPKPGFAVIVDDPVTVRGVLLVHRPDWRTPGDSTMTLQLEAQDPSVAAQLIAWLPHGSRYRILIYRPWLSELLQPLLCAERPSQEMHRLASPAAGSYSGCETLADPTDLRMAAGSGPKPSCREWTLVGKIP